MIKLRREQWFGFTIMALIVIPVLTLTPWSHLMDAHLTRADLGVLGLLMLALIVVAIMLGFPTAFTLMGMGVFFAWLAYRSVNPQVAVAQTLDLFVQRTYGVMSNDVLIAIPLFLFMGYLVERAQLIDRLFRSLHLATSRVPGSLAVATIVTCAIFATATGIVGAVVTLMGLLAFPAMLKAGYDQRLSAGVICAGGTLGILIPPSIMLIVYAATASVSVVRLYAAAMLPGLVLAGLYVVYVTGRASLNPKLAPALPKGEAEVPWARAVLLLVQAVVPLAALILAVLGSILFGLATPTEAAAVGALGALVLAAAYRALTWSRLREAVYLTARTSAMVCFLFVGSWTFSSVFSYLGGEGLIKDFVLGLNLNPVAFLLLSQLIIFLLGWPLEWTEIIVIFCPIFIPLLSHFNVDPILFGTMVAVNLQAAFLSPPVAMSAFYLKGVSPKHVTINQIFAGMMPYMLIVVVCLIFMYIWPGMTLWLPEFLYGQ